MTGQQRFRSDHADFRAPERGQRVNLRARDARVEDVADDGHPKRREILLVMTDGEHVEQALSRVRVPAVAGVDHVNVGSDVA
ncbi:hypothetical protein D3C83_58720 [compost metagenome]